LILSPFDRSGAAMPTCPPWNHRRTPPPMGHGTRPPPTDGAHTIDFPEAGEAQGPNDDPLPYSQHRSVMSYVYW